jgi:peptide chain release factor subunit 1
MITREEIRELASHQSEAGCAVSFYFQPSTPKDQSHREETLHLKELVRAALRAAEVGGPNACARADLDRILGMSDRIHNNGGKAKAIFADSSKGIWREFDVPPRFASTQLIVNSRFRLKPLAPLLEFTPRVSVVLVDRSKARLYDYTMGEAKEVLDFFNDLPRVGESDGFAGFDAGHKERHAAEIAKHHYKRVDDTVLKMYNRGGWDFIAFGTRDEQWHEIEEVLHQDIRQRVLGRFHIDPSQASSNTIVSEIERLLSDRDQRSRDEIMDTVVGEAKRNGNGAVGLRRVLGALEKGEIQTLVIGDQFEAPGVECPNCGHLEFSSNEKCTLCEHKTTAVDDLADAIIGAALRNGIEIMSISNDDRLANNGHIAAKLRFRSDQNTPMKLAS